MPKYVGSMKNVLVHLSEVFNKRKDIGPKWIKANEKKTRDIDCTEHDKMECSISHHRKLRTINLNDLLLNTH